MILLAGAIGPATTSVTGVPPSKVKLTSMFDWVTVPKLRTTTSTVSVEERSPSIGVTKAIIPASAFASGAILKRPTLAAL